MMEEALPNADDDVDASTRELLLADCVGLQDRPHFVMVKLYKK